MLEAKSISVKIPFPLKLKYITWLPAIENCKKGDQRYFFYTWIIKRN